ncbi:MAG: LolA-related protein [Pseudomonadota bacterium]
MKNPFLRLMLPALLLVSVAVTHADMHEQGAWSLENLMRDIATIESRTNRFTESKELAILELTLTQTGTLHFQSPDRLNKQILSPEASSFEIAGSQLTIKSAGNPDQVMMLDDNPQLRAFAESIRAVLAGDLQALQRHFHTRLEGSSAQWQLFLQPLDNLLAMQIDKIEILGEATDIRQFIVLENGGDRTVTTLEPFRD